MPNAGASAPAFGKSMSRTLLDPVPAHEKSPFPAETGRQLATGAAILLLTLAALSLMGRGAVCPCGIVTVWQHGKDPAENSQQFSDWYSLLHAAFGMALFGAVRRLRSHWPIAPVLLAVLLGHSIWEVAENTPWFIDVFSGRADAPPYRGDSLLNSFGDTVFALAAAALTPLVPRLAVVLLVVAAEIAVTWGVDDGFVVGTLRLLRVPV